MSGVRVHKRLVRMRLPGIDTATEKVYMHSVGACLRSLQDVVDMGWFMRMRVVTSLLACLDESLAAPLNEIIEYVHGPTFLVSFIFTHAAQW